ncbi:von Willebrand factor type A domain-containing protein [Xylaria digitata]|nr:von Willebrand factor type A domain-containing protein [Xylaria digitata]
MQAHATIKDVTSRTVLTLTFSNHSIKDLKDTIYSFPLYDGVSVVSFTATIGDVWIYGTVKEKEQARCEYHDAVNKGFSAGLLEQSPETSDVFVTSIVNVPAGAKVIVEVIYIGELRHNTESNGIRFTLPSSIAPRYGMTLDDIIVSSALNKTADTIKVTVDFQSPDECLIQQIQSPSHPISISIGRTSTMPTIAYMANRGSATVLLDATMLNRDFIVIANIKNADIPKALLETHATIANQRALMTTLVPRFNVTPTYGEIVFIVDMSGSMRQVVIQALTILLKSLPVGTKFNICSFGSQYSFLRSRSKSYNEVNLNEALNHIATFDVNFGGTEMRLSVQATISQRFSDILLNAIILTDGESRDKEVLFDIIWKASIDYKRRFFSLGIDSGLQLHSQFVAKGEKMNTKLIRLLKGALTPHVDDYSLEMKYKQDDEDFEIIESVKATSKADIILLPVSIDGTTPKPPISLTTNLILTPEAVILRATCSDSPLELEIKVEDIGKGETIHQLAARKAVSELEKNSGWLTTVTNGEDGILIKNKYDGCWEEIVEREAIRLGVKYHIAGKWCSFVAVQGEIEHEAVSQRGSMPGALPASISRRVIEGRNKVRDGPSTYSRVAKDSDQLATSSSISAPNDKMYEIIQLQRFDGYWEWDQRLLSVLGIGLNPERQDAILATALAIAFLEKRMTYEAEQWLCQQNGFNVETEISDAEKLLGSEMIR